ncbi:MAG: YfhO family protein [bacterium]|nr:YfhO family protein [bacterium]
MSKNKKLYKEKPKDIQKGISETTLNRIFIAVFFILPLIYFASFLSGSKMIAGSDWLLSGYIPRMWLADCIKHYGSGPLWDPNVFCGLPMGNPYNIYTLFYLIFPVHIVFTYSFVLAIFLAGLGMYLYLKELRFPILISFLGGIAYMSCGSLLSTPYAGHLGKSLAAALFPFILLFLHKGLTRHRLIYFLIAGALGALSATHAHFQLTYYAGVVCAFYLLFHLIWQRKENKIKGAIKLITYSILGLVLAGGLVSMQYLPIFSDFGWGSRGGLERGYEFATSWSVPTSELLDLLTPHFSGILNNYWGENYFKLHTEYLGILPLLLAFIGIAVKHRKKYVRFFIGLGVVATLFALGGHSPFYRIPYYLLPRVNKFRAPSMAFYLVAFSIIVLMAFGVQAVMEQRRKTEDQRQKTKDRRPKTIDRKQKNLIVYLLIIFGIVAIFAIICSVGKESVLSFLKGHFQPALVASYGYEPAQQKIRNLYQNYPNFIGGLGKALLLIAVNSVLIILLAMKKLKLPVWILIVTPILIFDQWSVEKQFLRSVPHPKIYYAPDSVVNFLQNDKTLYRVFPFNYEHTTDSYLTLYNIQSLGGYVSNPGWRYQKLIGAGESVMFNPRNLIIYPHLLDVLNVKYIISYSLPDDISRYDETTQGYIRELRNYLSQFKEVTRGGKYSVYLNTDYIKRAFIVKNYKVLDNPDSLLSFMLTPTFNAREVVLLEEEPSTDHGSTEPLGIEPRDELLGSELAELLAEVRLPITARLSPSVLSLGTNCSAVSLPNCSPKSDYPDAGEISITKYTPNEIVCEATLASPGFLVLSENWHPNWKAYVDGEEEKIYIADYTSRAVYLPEGEHNVRFVYVSKAFQVGSIISILSLIFFVGIVVWTGISKRRVV